MSISSLNRSIEQHNLLKSKINQFLAEKKGIERKILNEASDGYRPKAVKEKIDEALKNVNVTLWLEQDGERRSITLQNIVGSGGQKKAWQVTDRNVLMLPNYDGESVSCIANSWEKTVTEELMVSRFLTQQNLLSCNHQFVKIFISPQSESFIPAYLSDSFEHLKKNNLFILEGKTNKSGTWLKEKIHFFFQNTDDKLNEECWDEVLKPLVLDISKIIKYGIPAYGDSFNIAVYKREDANCAGSPYHVRYFGLDFSKKSEHQVLSLIERTNLSPEIVKKEAASLLSQFLERLMEIECPFDYTSLKNSLVNRCAQEISRQFTH